MSLKTLSKSTIIEELRAFPDTTYVTYHALYGKVYLVRDQEKQVSPAAKEAQLGLSYNYIEFITGVKLGAIRFDTYLQLTQETLYPAILVKDRARQRAQSWSMVDFYRLNKELEVAK